MTETEREDTAVAFHATAEPPPAPERDVWAELRQPFPEDWLELLPKVMSKSDNDRGRCEEGSRYTADGEVCGGWHARAVHLTYVGHAGITDRLNDVVGPGGWDWQPLVTSPEGFPVIKDGCLWIKLTIGGVTKLAVGDAQGKTGPNATKEIIGDAIRNGCMRFGIGTYLWAKSKRARLLQAAEPDTEPEPQQQRREEPRPPVVPPHMEWLAEWLRTATQQGKDSLKGWAESQGFPADWRTWSEEQGATAKAAMEAAAQRRQAEATDQQLAARQALVDDLDRELGAAPPETLAAFRAWLNERGFPDSTAEWSMDQLQAAVDYLAPPF